MSSSSAIGVQNGFQSAYMFCKDLEINCIFEEAQTFLTKLLEEAFVDSLLLVKGDARRFYVI